MAIELRHLRYFLAVADELHFGRAAERLGMSQPPLSQQIRQLEKILGVRLFERTNRRVSLTDAGHRLVEEAHALLARTEQAVDRVQRAARGESGELHIGFTRSTPLSERIPRAILAFRRQWPSVQLDLHELNSLQQIEALLDGKLHVGMVRNGELPQPLVSRRLFADPLVAVVRSDHPLLMTHRHRQRLSASTLANEPFVLFARAAGTSIHDQVLELCRQAGFTPRVAQAAQEASTIIGLVAAGLGVSILPASCAHIHMEGVSYLPLRDRQAMSYIHVVYRRDLRSPLVTHFTRLLSKDTAS